MKRLLLVFLVGLGLAACSADSEELNLDTNEVQDLKVEILDEFILRGEGLNSGEANKQFNKLAYKAGDNNLSNDKDFFINDCSNLTLVDFENLEVGAFKSPLDKNTENAYVSPGEIPEGIFFTTQNSPANFEDLILLSYTTKRLYHRGRSVNPEYSISLVLNFTTEVKKVGLDIVGLFSGANGVTVEYYGNTGILSTEVITISGITFLGYTSLEPIIKIVIYQETNEGFIGVDNVYFGGFCDTDGDGCTDEIDTFINSNMESTVNIRGCDSKVENKPTSTCGVMMADEIDALESKTYSQPSLFRSELINLTNLWVDEEIITTSEANLLLKCVAFMASTYTPAPTWPRTCWNPFRRNCYY